MKRAIYRGLLTAFVLIATILLAVPGIGLAADGNQQIDDTEAAGAGSIGHYYKGPEFVAAVVAISEEGPIRDDLIARGLFTYPDDETGEPGLVKVGEIKKLVEAGVYYIDETNRLRIGSQTDGQEAAATAKNALVYKYAEMVTRRLEIWDDFKYRGHRCYVHIPADIDLEPGTKQNLYCTHMGTSDAYYFVECGVGWGPNSSNPFIYTYDTYTYHLPYKYITSGVSRDIYLKIDIDSEDYTAKMYVRDPYTGKTVTTYQEVIALNHRADQCQEQASYTDTWTETPKVKQFDNRLKNKSDKWVKWNDSIATDWDHNAPLYESHGITNDMKWIKTWCNP